MMSGEPVNAELYNALGALVKNIEMDQVAGKTTINVDSPGFYTLRVNMKKEVKIFKLIGN
ncbi:MAG: T9SS type A sorting domain-containing protein [Draconibacterium sp.]|nr:T9SS type A sorting domain-containing protein [Draconibacterium sp.]